MATYFKPKKKSGDFNFFVLKSGDFNFFVLKSGEFGPIFSLKKSFACVIQIFQVDIWSRFTK